MVRVRVRVRVSVRVRGRVRVRVNPYPNANTNPCTTAKSDNVGQLGNFFLHCCTNYQNLKN